MKKIAFTMVVICILTLLLTACANTAEPVSKELICYPGLEWNMSREEVMEALDIDPAAATENGKPLPPDQQVFCVKDWSYLGRKATILFEFYNHGADRGDWYGLRRVVLFYPASANADALTKKMEEMLGEGEAVHDGDWLRWDSEKQYSDFFEAGMADLKAYNADKYEETYQQSLGTTASYVTLHYEPYLASLLALSPSQDWDETGIFISFYANHIGLLQAAQFGLEMPG